MNNYLNKNYKYWQSGYFAPNVESYIFRFYAYFLKTNKITGRRRLLDFGCGQGAAVNYFNNLGYDAIGVDISKKDITYAKKNYKKYKNKFYLVNPDPDKENFYGFKSNIDVVVAGQALYFFDDDDLQICLKKIRNSMKVGGIIYATMQSNKHYYFDNSKKRKNGLYEVKLKNRRTKVDSHYINFTFSKKHLIKKFEMFKPLEIGYYDIGLTSSEPQTHHYTFIGRKER